MWPNYWTDWADFLHIVLYQGPTMQVRRWAHSLERNAISRDQSIFYNNMETNQPIELIFCTQFHINILRIMLSLNASFFPRKKLYISWTNEICGKLETNRPIELIFCTQLQFNILCLLLSLNTSFFPWKKLYISWTNEICGNLETYQPIELIFCTQLNANILNIMQVLMWGFSLNETLYLVN